MKCRDLKFDLPLYSDDILSPAERSELDAHLDICPLCRQALSEYQSLRNDLRALTRPVFAQRTADSIRAAVNSELRPSFGSPSFRLVETRRNWYATWFMPSAIGTFASVVMGLSLVWAILVTAPGPSELRLASSADTTQTVSASSHDLSLLGPDSLDLSPSEYASSRLAVAGESPSINPQGALVALTRSLVRGKMNDDEVVVVAEVFGNGLAKITQVVEPTDDSRAIRQLEKALDSDPTFAPFVPASFDKRSETTRVVLKIQNVNVNTNLNVKKRNLTDRRRS